MPTPMLTLTFFFNFFNVDADEIADADANADANADVDANGDTNWKQIYLKKKFFKFFLADADVDAD